MKEPSILKLIFITILECVGLILIWYFLVDSLVKFVAWMIFGYIICAAIYIWQF